ncbi:MAG: glutamate synthase subunit beta [Chloroflexota bacterium]|nr:glutamate synthase subunit beta [Chloroflexota bacterium]
MGKSTGFTEFIRQVPARIPVKDRLKNYQEIYLPWSEELSKNQGARCMNCGIPFCHSGCPLGNLIPDWNDLVYRGEWKEALDALHSTNNFPEFTGRICPAPCEAACTLNINNDPVTIEYIEKAIADKGWDEGWITPHPPTWRSGKSVAVVGSGPAGMAAAAQLNHAGHLVTLYERNEVIGGLLRLGIPDFKLEKDVVQRRVDQMAAEGVTFVTNADIGQNVPVAELKEKFDAIVLTGGSTVPRDLDVPGRELDGIHPAMDYLTMQNRINTGTEFPDSERITAEGKHVIILGGGDTGADCLGTAHRQGALSVHQFELLPEPPVERNDNNPWPQWPQILRSSSAHEEGGVRDYNIQTKSFTGIDGQVAKLHGIRLEWGPPDETGRPSMKELEGTEFEIEADLVLFALGFLHPEKNGMLDDFGVELDGRGNVSTNTDRMTSVPGVFAAGDMHRGQSLVVWALAEGRQAAHGVDKYLMGATELPAPLAG